MIEDDRYRADILNQTLAIRSVLAQVEVLILQDHADDCVEDAVNTTDASALRNLGESSPIEERGNETSISNKRSLIDRR